MKKFIVLFAMISATIALSQDSIRTIDKFFAVDSSKISHAIDFRVFDYYDLGYNFYYKLNNHILIGGRIGFWPYKSDPLQYPLDKPRAGFQYFLQTSMNFQLWKSSSLEFDLGYYNRISWPTENNTFVEEKGSNVSLDFYTFGASVKAILFNHLVLKEGFIIRYTGQTGLWHPFVMLSLGYTF